MSLKKFRVLEDLWMERFFYSTSSMHKKWSFSKRILLLVNLLVTCTEEILKNVIICISFDVISLTMINVDMHQASQKLNNLDCCLLEFMLRNIHNWGTVNTKLAFTYSKLTVKTPERWHWRRWLYFDVFIVKIEQILHIVMFFPS